MTAQMPMCITFEDNFWDQLMWDEDLSDTKIVLVDNDGKTIWSFSVHSIVLRRRSLVFKDLIKSVNEVVTFKNVDLLVLKKFIQFLYVGDVYIESWEEIVQFLELALRYKVETLTDELESSLNKFVTLINVCDILEVAVKFGLNVLEGKCIDLIVRGAVIVFGTSGFQRLSDETIAKIIADHRLNVVKEIDVIQYLICWAKAKAFVQGIKLDDSALHLKINPFLKYVRFTKITPEDQTLLPVGIRALVFPSSAANYSAEPLYTSPVKPPAKLKDREPSQDGCLLDYYANVLLRDMKSANISWFNAGGSEQLVLRFSVTMPIFLGGFVISFRLNGIGAARVVIRQTVSKTVREEKEIRYPLKHKLCEHRFANEMVGRDWYQVVCYEPESPILLKPNEECNVYLALQGATVWEMPKIPLPFTTFKTDEGPTIRMHLDSVSAVRKIFFLSACGRCNINH